MMTDTVQLPTIERLKSRAKTIKKRDGVSHSAALDRAARVSGFENFRQAQSAIGQGTRPPVRAAGVFVSARWQQHVGSYLSGRGTELVEVSLPCPLTALLPDAPVTEVPDFPDFLAAAPDHLKGRVAFRTRAEARASAEKAAQRLRRAAGLDATGEIGTWTSMGAGHFDSPMEKDGVVAVRANLGVRVRDLPRMSSLKEPAVFGLRPPIALPFGVHIELGRVLKEVCSRFDLRTADGYNEDNALNRFVMKLVDWMYGDDSDDHVNVVADDVYGGRVEIPTDLTGPGHLVAAQGRLERVRGMIGRHVPDCEARDMILRMLDEARDELPQLARRMP